MEGLRSLVAGLTNPPAARTGRLPAAFLLASAALAGFVHTGWAADGTWSEFTPPTRSGHAAVYDPLRDRMWVFGGTEGGTLRNEVWALPLSGESDWVLIETEGDVPSARKGHSAIYDPLRDRVIVFGGHDGTYLNDVWVLSLAGTPTWAEIAPVGIPPAARSDHSAVYDPVDDRILIFGGAANPNDVWELALGGVPTWKQLVPTGNPPPARAGHSAIFDPVRRRMLIYGGNWTRNDLWALDLAGDPFWTQIVPPGTQPYGRGEHTALYDPVRDRMIICGGAQGSGYGYMVGDCRALPLVEGASWELVGGLALFEHAGFYDPQRDAIVVYGGNSDYGHRCNTWRLPLDEPSPWELVSPAQPWSPSLSGHTAIHDPVGDRMVVFGGRPLGCGEPCASRGTWVYPLSGQPEWSYVDIFGPGERHDHTAVYDSRRQRMLVFGGDEVYFDRLNDTWALPLTGNLQWIQIIPSGSPPAPRRAHSAIYDPVRDRMLVFGGTDGWYWPYGGIPFNDVWELSLADGAEWTLLVPLGTAPSPRMQHSAIYDPIGDRMLIFGGGDATELLNDLWALELGGVPEWTELAPLGTPPSPRGAHTVMYDQLRAQMVVFGGTPAGDVWTLDLRSPLVPPTWSPFDAGGVPPGGRDDPAAIYQPAEDRMVVSGGGRSPAVSTLTFDEAAAIPPASPPSLLQFVFHGVRPNPASGDFAVLFELPGSEATKLELFDVAGRHAAARDLGVLGAGSHQVWFEGVQLPAGIYLVRLTHGVQTLNVKVSLLH